MNNTLFVLPRFWLGMLTLCLVQYLLHETDFRHTSPHLALLGTGFVVATYAWFLLEGGLRTALQIGVTLFDRGLAAMLALPGAAIVVGAGILAAQGREDLLAAFALGTFFYHFFLRKPVLAIVRDIDGDPRT